MLLQNPILKVFSKFWSKSSNGTWILKNEVKSGDLLLVKGSQNTLLLEIAVEMLMKNPADADKLLPRRSSYWDNKRAEIKNLI